MRKPEPEIVNFGKKYGKIFKEAIQKTSERTYISNTSIEVKEDGTVIIEDTRASFLINLGMEYQKLLTKEGIK